MSTTGDTEYSGEDEASPRIRGHLIDSTLVLVTDTKLQPLTQRNVQLEVVVSGADAVEATQPATGTCEEVHVANSPQGMSVRATVRLSQPLMGSFSNVRDVVGMFPGNPSDEQDALGLIHRIVARKIVIHDSANPLEESGSGLERGSWCRFVPWC